MSNLTEITVPDIGDSQDVAVIEVLVSPGDAVEVEDALVTLESDKATMDVPAPVAGTVGELRVSIGDTVSEGTVILTIDANCAPAPESLPCASGEGVETPAPPGSALSPITAIPPRSGPPDSESRPAADSQPPLSTGTIPDPRAPRGRPSPTAAIGDATTPSGPRSHATPSVRRFARELGVSVADVLGTGRKGRVLRDDVTSFVKTVLTGPGRAPTASGGEIPRVPEVDFARFGPVETVALSRIQKVSGPHLRRSWLNVPHVTHHDEADITALEAFRVSLKEKAGEQGVRLTMLAFVLKALAACLREYPSFNASLAPDGESLILKKYVHLGVAVDTPGGLVVPVIRDVDDKRVMSLAAELGEVSARARDGKLQLQDLQGGCMSVSSLGGIGGRAFTPIVNAPEVAILGVARAKMTPEWNGREFEPKLMLPLSLSYDHRVIDGAQAARFVVHLGALLQDIRRLIL